MSNMLKKSKLSTEDQMLVASEFGKKQKSKGIAYALWFFLLPIGAHRFYLGDPVHGICMILFGWCTLFIWPLIDGLFISKRLDMKNEAVEAEIINDIMVMRGYNKEQ